MTAGSYVACSSVKSMRPPISSSLNLAFMPFAGGRERADGAASCSSCTQHCMLNWQLCIVSFAKVNRQPCMLLCCCNSHLGRWQVKPTASQNHPCSGGSHASCPLNMPMLIHRMQALAPPRRHPLQQAPALAHPSQPRPAFGHASPHAVVCQGPGGNLRGAACAVSPAPATGNQCTRRLPCVRPGHATP